MTIEELFSAYNPAVRELAQAARALVKEVIPDAHEAVDGPAHMLLFSFVPGTYRGAIVEVVLNKAYVNLQFARGVELVPLERQGLLEGTGKQGGTSRFEIRGRERLQEPTLRSLLQEAAEITPRK